MSRTDEHDPQPLSEHEIERYMTAFQACLHVMDANPAEAARIGRLAGKTDAQTLGETPGQRRRQPSRPGSGYPAGSAAERAGGGLAVARRRAVEAADPAGVAAVLAWADAAVRAAAVRAAGPAVPA